MALRYVLLNASVLAAAGGATTYPHGILNRNVAAAPTVWWWVPSQAHPGANVEVYRTTLPTTTQGPGLAGSGAATPTVDFFCSLPHSIIG
jgi:hypothetical protein